MIKTIRGDHCELNCGGNAFMKFTIIIFWQFYGFRKYSTVFTFRHYLNIHLNTYTLQTCISDFISHLSYHDECTQNWHYALQITFKVTFFFKDNFRTPIPFPRSFLFN